QARSSSEEAQELVRKARAETIRQAGGRMPDAEAEPPVHAAGMMGIVGELAHAHVTLSTVAIGEKPNLELMKNLAARGGGKSYVAARDAEIPSLFGSEARRLLGEAIVEEAFRPKVMNATEVLAGVDF